MTDEKRKDLPVPASAVDDLFDRVVAILERARDRVVRSVNSEMVIAYWHIGREIVEHLQAGEERAAYGRRLLESLSGRLRSRYGRGFSATNLRYFRLFYQAYSDRPPEIRHKPCDELESTEKRNAPRSELSIGGAGQKHHKAGDVSEDLALATSPADPLGGFASGLSWSHYRTLTKVQHRAERLFYEIEAEKQNWSVRPQERGHRQVFGAQREQADLRGPIPARPAD